MKRSSLKRKEKYSKKSVGFDSESSHVNKTFAQVKELNRQLKKTKPKPVWPKLVLPVLLALLIIGTGLFMITPVFTGLSVENVTNVTGNMTITAAPGIGPDNFITLKRGIHNRYSSKDIEFELDILDSLSKDAKITGKAKKAILRPSMKSISKIEFHNLSIIDDEISLGMEDLRLGRFKQSYALDPTQLNFTDAIVTVTAKGRTLFKCEEWDFASRDCDGQWTVFKTGLVPGEEYNFTLTADDPAFGEGDYFFEDWESGSLDTNGWSYTSGSSSGWEVLTSDGPIDAYHAVAENTDGEATLEAAVSTVGYENVTFSFYWKTGSNNLDVVPTEYYRAEWYNGTGWTQVFSFDNGKQRTYTLASYNLPSSAANNANFRIRFLCNVNSNNEACHLDNINVSATPIDNDAPASVTNLAAQFVTNDSIYWNWTNPVDIDFSKAIIYLNNNNVANTSNNYYNATGLTNNTEYNIKIHTKDTSGNVNTTDITDTNNTLQNAIYSVTLTDPSDQTTSPGTNVTYLITVTNTGNQPDNYTLAVTNYNSSDIAELNETSILDLSNDSSRVVELTVGHSTSGNYTVQVNATSDTTPTSYDAVNIKTIITTNTVYGVDISYEGDQQTDEYTNATYNITISNIGNADENITLSLINYNNSDFAILNQTTILDLENSTSTYILLDVADSTPGTYIVQINATVDNDPSKYKLLNITTTVLDTTPPAGVTNLNNQTYAYDYIFWNWTSPLDADFNHTEVWIDNVFITNITTPDNYYNATGLEQNTYYTVQTRTVDHDGNINTTWVNNTARTNSTDQVAPTINSITDSPDPLAEGQNITITANVTDDVNLTIVYIEINGTNYTMLQNSEVIGNVTDIFFDNFNDGDITDWNSTLGSTSGWFTTDTESPYDGNHTIARDTDGDAIIEKTISTVGYKDVEFRFYWSTDTNNLDVSDYYHVEWYNGTGWTRVLSFESGSSTAYQQATYFLPASADDRSDFKVRFICNVNQGTEGCNVDDVQVSAKPFTPATPDIWYYGYNTSGIGAGIHTYYVHALDWVNNYAVNSSTFTIIGDAYYGVDLTDPADKLIDNSSTAKYFITLTNNGSVTDSYTLSVNNYDAADTAQLNQTSIVSVPPNATRIFTLSVASSTPGNYAVGITATSAGNNSVYDSINITTEIEPYYPPPANTLFFDGFESGLFSTYSWSMIGNWYVATTDPYSGIYYAESSATTGEAILTQNISTVGFGHVELSFYWDTDGLDFGEYLRAEWYDGTAWVRVLDTHANPAAYQYANYSLPVGASDSEDFAIRFICLSNLGSEECKVDNVLVTGIDIYNPNVTNIKPDGNYYEFNSTVVVNATVTDNVNVSQVFMNVSWPGDYYYVEMFDTDNNTVYTANMSNFTYYGVYNISIYANDTAGNINNTETGLFVVPYPIKILNITLSPDDDEFTNGTQINPLEDSNITINMTANLTNTSIIDTCVVNIYNSTGLFKGPFFGTVSVINDRTQCFANWSMEYWRSVGDYNVTVFVNRTDSVSDNNYTTFYYNELKSFNINTSIIGFNSVPGTTTNSTTAYPLGVKNTGNVPLNISIDGTDFIGQSNPAFQIGIQNITYNETGTGLFLPLTHTLTDIPSMQYLQPTVIQSLYFRGYAPFGLLAQEYNSNITFSGQ